MTLLLDQYQFLKIIPGDLISVAATFNIKLSDFGITNSMIGNRVSDKIQIKVNLVGSNYDQK